MTDKPQMPDENTMAEIARSVMAWVNEEVAERAAIESAMRDLNEKVEAHFQRERNRQAWLRWLAKCAEN